MKKSTGSLKMMGLKLLAGMMIISSFVAFGPVIDVSAASLETQTGTALFLDTDEIAKILEQDRLLRLCPENNALVAAREAEFNDFLRRDQSRSRNQRFIMFNTINVPVFQQERGYWCGPATARQVIHFRNGSSPSQATLAGNIGTSSNGSDVHAVGREVNRHTNTNYGAGWLSENRATWVDQIRFSIDRRQPALLTIDTMRVAAFPYNSSGHIINVSGYDLAEVWDGWDISTMRLDGSIRITDPFGPGLGNRWYSVNNLFSAHVTNRNAPFRGRASW